MKVWIKRDLNKGYIPSDKVSFRGQRFEATSLSNWNVSKNDPLEKIQKAIKTDTTDTIVYLNVNFDGVQAFMKR